MFTVTSVFLHNTSHVYQRFDMEDVILNHISCNFKTLLPLPLTSNYFNSHELLTSDFERCCRLTDDMTTTFVSQTNPATDLIRVHRGTSPVVEVILQISISNAKLELLQKHLILH